MDSSAEIKILLAVENSYYERLLEVEISKRLPDAVILFARDVCELTRIISTGKVSLAIFDTDNTEVTVEKFFTVFAHINLETELVLLTTDDYSVPSDINKKISSYSVICKDSAFPGNLPLLLTKLTDCTRPVQQPVHPLNIVQDNSLEYVTTGMISHEISNPLMSILGICELILDDPAPGSDDIVDKVKMIHTSAKRIKSVLRKLSSSDRRIINNTRFSAYIDSEESIV